MNASEMVDTGLPMARIASLRVIGPTSLEIGWAEGARAGRTDLVDVTPVIGTYKVYRQLRNDPKLFATAHLKDEGYVVAWDGFDIDMSAETIEALAEESMTPAEFAAFLDRNHLTQDAAAALLGRSRRQICYYLNPGPVPRVVALACVGYEALKHRKAGQAA
jgi:Protein of unknown function (DUF2442)